MIPNFSAKHGVRLLPVFILLLALPATAPAQSGQIRLHADSSVIRVLALYRNYLMLEHETFGYRIQIAAAGNRNQIMEVKVRFLKLFPDVPNYVEYQAPQFKFRIGDFKTRNEAEMFLEEIRKHFPNAFIVMGKIRASRIDW